MIHILTQQKDKLAINYNKLGVICSIYNQLWQLRTKLMNILCNEGDFCEKSVNEGDIGLTRGKHGNEGDWSKIGEPPPKWGSVGSYELYVCSFPFYMFHQKQFEALIWTIILFDHNCLFMSNY